MKKSLLAAALIFSTAIASAQEFTIDDYTAATERYAVLATDCKVELQMYGVPRNSCKLYGEANPGENEVDIWWNKFPQDERLAMFSVLGIDRMKEHIRNADTFVRGALYINQITKVLDSNQ